MGLRPLSDCVDKIFLWRGGICKFLAVVFDCYRLPEALEIKEFKLVKNPEMPVPTEVKAKTAPAAISPMSSTYSVIVAPLIAL